MTNNKNFMTMSIELRNDWLFLVQKISEAILPVSFLLEARSISAKNILQKKDLELMSIIPKEIFSLEYINYYYASEKIDFVIRKAESVIGLLPEEISILFFDKQCQFPTECIKTDSNEMIRANENIYCTINVMIDENVILISVSRNYLEKIRNLLKEYY